MFLEGINHIVSKGKIMKKLLLFLTFICLLAPSQASAAGFYVSPKITLIKDTGFSFGVQGAVGIDLEPMLTQPMRAEIEIGIYRTDSVSKYIEAESLLQIPIFTGLYYDFHLESGLTPYLGIGIGIKYSAAINGILPDLMSSTVDLGLVFTGGVYYSISESIDLDASYRLNYAGGLSDQFLFGIRYRF